MQPTSLQHICKLTPFKPENVMVLDRSTVENLELIYNFSSGSSGTLLEVLDKTCTAMGARTLRRWMLEPLLDFKAISARQDIVEAFHGEAKLRREVRELLDQVADIQRLTARTSSQRAGPRDVAALGRSLGKIPEINKMLVDSAREALKRVAKGLKEFPKLVQLISDAMVDDPPAQLADGGVIRQGYNAKLDNLRKLVTEGKDWIVKHEAEERERTGIKNLKVKYNKVFGYFIEVTKSNLHLVPDNYIRKQTISTGERYITQALKEYEDKVLGAEEKITSMEYELFCGLREHLAEYSGRLLDVAEKLGTCDVTSSLSGAPSASIGIELDHPGRRVFAHI